MATTVSTNSVSTPPTFSPEEIRKEVDANLGYIFTSEISYYGDHQAYASSFEQFNFNTEGMNRYAYFLPGGVVQASTGGPYSLPAGLSPVVGAVDFKIIAIANLDNDPALDIWSLDSSKNIVCLSDDLTATSPVVFNNAPADAIPSPVTPPPPVNPPVSSSKEPSSAPQAIQTPANLDSSGPNSNTASRPTPNSRPVPESATATRPMPGGQRSWSPSFDCSRASTNAERLICSSRELSEADVKLSQAYRAAQNLSTNKDTLRREQMAWQKNERDACSDVPCMLRAYQSRNSQLQVLE